MKRKSHPTDEDFMSTAVIAMKESGTDFFGVDSVDDLPFVDPDDTVTTCVDAREFEPVKMRALALHATQVMVDGPFFALSNNIGREAFGYEYYRLVQGHAARTTPTGARRTSSTACSEDDHCWVSRFRPAAALDAA